MSEIVNPRDILLQATVPRVEAVALPPNVIVKPGQLGPGALPTGVTNPSGVPFGALSGLNNVNLNNPAQVVGTLASSSVTGLGALAALNAINASPTAGQVTNLGQLAFANTLAADKIGAGILGAGIIYAGTIHVDRLVGNDIIGKNLIGGDSIFIGATNEFGSQVGMYTTGSVGCLYVKGIFNAATAGGVGVFSITPSGGVAMTGSTISMSGPLSGSTGSRILLSSQLYNAAMAIDGVTKDVQIRIIGPA